MRFVVPRELPDGNASCEDAACGDAEVDGSKIVFSARKGDQ
jgi:hypothetical protein